MQTLFKNLFNSIKLSGVSLIVFFIKIYQKPSVKGTLRYRKINFLTTSALFQLHYFGLKSLFVIPACRESFFKKSSDPLYKRETEERFWTSQNDANTYVATGFSLRKISNMIIKNTQPKGCGYISEWRN